MPDYDALNAAITGTLGATATVNGGSVAGVLTEAYVEIDSGLAGQGGTAPAFECKASDVSSVNRGAQITINSTVYRVAYKQPDDEDWCVLVLHKA